MTTRRSELAAETHELSERARFPLLHGFQLEGDEATSFRLAMTAEEVYGLFGKAIEHLRTNLGSEEDSSILDDLMIGVIHTAQLRGIQIGQASSVSGLPDFEKLYGIPNPTPIDQRPTTL